MLTSILGEKQGLGYTMKPVTGFCFLKSARFGRFFTLPVIAQLGNSRAEKAGRGVPPDLLVSATGKGHPGIIIAMTRHAFAAVLSLVLTFGSVLSAAGSPGRIEQATPAVKRFVSPSGYEVSFPNAWRVLEREGFDLFIDRLGGPGEAATLSFGAVNVAPKAREVIAADLAANEPQTIAGALALLRKRFPDAVVIRSGRTVLGNFPAVELVSAYSINNPGSRLDVLSWLIIGYRDGRLIRIQFEATGPQREALMHEAGTMLSSFAYGIE